MQAQRKDVVNSTYSPLFSTGAPSNITVAFCGAYARMGVNSARPFPCGVGSLRMLHSRPAVHTQNKMGAFFASTAYFVSCSSICRIMRAYAAYRRPQNIEFYSIRQKKHPFSCVCAVFVVNLQAIRILHK